MIPKNVVIKGKKYKIKIKDIGDGYNGLCDKRNSTIFINKNLGIQLTLETYVHEVIHAIIHESSIDQIISGDAEEVICDNIANEIVRLFVDIDSYKEEK